MGVWWYDYKEGRGGVEDGGDGAKTRGSCFLHLMEGSVGRLLGNTVGEALVRVIGCDDGWAC